MSAELPDYGVRSEPEYNDRNAMLIAFLGAVLMNAVIIGVFAFITWVAYNAD